MLSNNNARHSCIAEAKAIWILRVQTILRKPSAS